MRRSILHEEVRSADRPMTSLRLNHFQSGRLYAMYAKKLALSNRRDNVYPSIDSQFFFYPHVLRDECTDAVAIVTYMHMQCTYCLALCGGVSHELGQTE